jgi:hypothetical protein
MTEFEKLKREAIEGRTTRLHRILTDRMRRIIDDMILQGYRKDQIFDAVKEVMIEENKISQARR